MNTIYLSLGANIGDRERNIWLATEALSSRSVRVTGRSSLYETEPVDMNSKDWFLNCVVEAETALAPEELMPVLLELERALGRERLVLHGSRIIDIDILLFGSSVVHGPDLEIPHPRMAERRFVLVPFAEIAPDVQHPVLKKTIAALLSETTDRSEVRPWHAA